MLNRFPARTSRVFPEPRRCLRYASTSAAPLPEATMPMPALPPEILQLLSDDGLIQTVSNAFLHLPELSHTTYAGSVVLLVLALRSTFTLPVNLWQRRRTDRMQQLVMPKMNAWALQAREELRKKCRRQGKSYEEYVAIYNQAVSLMSTTSKIKLKPMLVLPDRPK